MRTYNESILASTNQPSCNLYKEHQPLMDEASIKERIKLVPEKSIVSFNK